MTNQPIPLDELEVIGYADTLPDGRGPAVVPPVFRHRADADRCYVPPFRIAGNWLIEPACIPFTEVQELEREERVTLPENFKHPARPEHQLWVDVNGQVRYEATTDARQNLQRLYREHLDAATAALREGGIDEAERLAGIALAANDRALEPRALVAACHALKGEESELVFMHRAAETAGQDAGSFGLLVKDYLETIPAETWEHSRANLELILKTCDVIGVRIWVPFRFTEDEYRQFRPLLHEFRRHGGEQQFLISCPGVEAVLMSERESLKVACADAETWIKEELRQINVLAVAAETMLYAPAEIAARCNATPDRVCYLGGLARKRISLQIVSAS